MKTKDADGMSAVKAGTVKAVPAGPQSGTRYETGQFRNVGIRSRERIKTISRQVAKTAKRKSPVFFAPFATWRLGENMFSQFFRR